MAKTDWGLKDTMRPSDLNAIGQEINQLRGDVDNMDFPLSDATDGTRSDVAASEKAVGLVMQEAQAGKQAGIDRKAEVVAALNSIGVSASTSESWAQLIPKMAAIIRATGNAALGDVLVGKTFSNDTGNSRTGTMANQGAQVITPGAANKAILAGYHNGSGYVVGDADLVAGNLPNDVNIFGIQGILERLTTADRNAIIAAINGKGVAASASDSNAVLAQKIGQIVTGAKYAAGEITSNSSGVVTISGIAFNPNIIALRPTGSSGNVVLVSRKRGVNYSVLKDLTGTSIANTNATWGTNSCTISTGAYSATPFYWDAYE